MQWNHSHNKGRSNVWVLFYYLTILETIPLIHFRKMPQSEWPTYCNLLICSPSVVHCWSYSSTPLSPHGERGERQCWRKHLLPMFRWMELCREPVVLLQVLKVLKWRRAHSDGWSTGRSYPEGEIRYWARWSGWCVYCDCEEARECRHREISLYVNQKVKGHAPRNLPPQSPGW